MQNRTVTDQMGRSVTVPVQPKRIVSIVPSQTELLFDLGLDEEIAGITKFCIHPAAQFKQKTKVGGTKTLRLDQIRQLQPDLIIGNKEENDRRQVEELMQDHPVWMSDISTLDDALQMIGQVGNLVGREQRAHIMLNEVRSTFTALAQAVDGQEKKPKRVLYLIWRKPYMLAGKNTFIDDMLLRAGFENAVTQQRYPEMDGEMISSLQPEVIFLSSEPYPFKEKHLTEFKSLCPDADVRIVDGELFCWYGSRLRHTAEYLQRLHDRKLIR